MNKSTNNYTPDVNCLKSRVVTVLTLMAAGATLPDSNGLAYSLNERGELCYIGPTGNLTVSGMSFNDFSRKAQAHVGRLLLADAVRRDLTPIAQRLEP